MEDSMDYKEQLTGYLSSCDGKACDVFYEIYSIIGSLKAIEQPLAVRFMCENVFKIDSDYSKRIKKSYYTPAQFRKADETATRKFNPILEKTLRSCIQESVYEDLFYKTIWSVIQENSALKTKREKAYALYKLAVNPLIPYRNVGTGLSMDNSTFKEMIKNFEESLLDDTRYIIKFDYQQRTQRASLIADKIMGLHSDEERAVYLALVLQEAENGVKEQMQAAIAAL